MTTFQMQLTAACLLGAALIGLCWYLEWRGRQRQIKSEEELMTFAQRAIEFCRRMTLNKERAESKHDIYDLSRDVEGYSFVWKTADGYIKVSISLQRWSWDNGRLHLEMYIYEFIDGLPDERQRKAIQCANHYVLESHLSPLLDPIEEPEAESEAVLATDDGTEG